MEYLTILSAIFLIISIYLYIFKSNIKSKIIRFVISFFIFLSFIFYIFHHISNYFTGEGINDAVIYYLMLGLRGAGFRAYSELITGAILFLVIALIFSLWLFSSKSSKKIEFIKSNKFKKPLKKRRDKIMFIILTALVFSILLNPFTLGLKNLQQFSYQNQYKETLTNIYSEDALFSKYYITPRVKQISEPKNLVFIYAEGLERTYMNESLFPNLTENLKKIDNESISFLDIISDPKSDHTMAGLVASQCGIPLISHSRLSMSGMELYLPSATCLGDILHNEGYFLSYYGGAHLNFGEKGKFYKTHKFDEVIGKKALIPKQKNPNYQSYWGAYDDSLLNITYQRFEELSQEKEKFALFLLTLDTHHPSGYPSKSCKNITYQNGKNPMLNSVACSDYLISEFVKKIRNSKYDRNTVIVIASDHLASPNTAKETLNKGKRRNLFIINTPESKGENLNISGSTLDIGSTILPYIGYKADIGLGRNLLDKNNTEEERKKILGNLNFMSSSIMGLWDFPYLKDYIGIDTKNNKFYVDGRRMDLPILIEIKRGLKIKPYFEFDVDSDYSYSLSKKANELVNKTQFVLVNKCEDINISKGSTNSSKEFCLLFHNNKSLNFLETDKNLIFTKKEIINILDLQDIEKN